MDYSDEVGPYAGTVSSVGASGEVCVDFDDGSWAALKKPAERARMALEPGRQLLKRRKGRSGLSTAHRDTPAVCELDRLGFVGMCGLL